MTTSRKVPASLLLALALALTLGAPPVSAANEPDPAQTTESATTTEDSPVDPSAGSEGADGDTNPGASPSDTIAGDEPAPESDDTAGGVADPDLSQAETDLTPVHMTVDGIEQTVIGDTVVRLIEDGRELDPIVSVAEQLTDPEEPPAYIVQGDTAVLAARGQAGPMAGLPHADGATVHLKPVFAVSASENTAENLANVEQSLLEALALWGVYSNGTFPEFNVVTDPAMGLGMINFCDFAAVMEKAELTESYTNQDTDYYVVYRETACSGTSGRATLSGTRMVLYRADEATQTMAHEFGHNFGLHHSGNTLGDLASLVEACPNGSWQDQSTSDDPPACNLGLDFYSYGDFLSTMGNIAPGFPAVGQLDQLGLLPGPSSIWTSNDIGIYDVTLAAMEKFTDVMAAKIGYSQVNAASGMRGEFYIEYRISGLEPEGVVADPTKDGVQIRYIPDSTRPYVKSWLLPLREADYPDRFSLRSGDEWTDPNDAFTVRVLALDPANEQATIEIQIDKPPTFIEITKHPQNKQYFPGESVTLTSDATGYPNRNPTPQWQRFNEATSEWIDIPGATQKSYSIASTYFGDDTNGSLFRVVYFALGQGEVASEVASVTEATDGRPVFLTSLPDVTVASDQYFPVVAAFIGTPPTQVRIRVDSVGAWPSWGTTLDWFASEVYATASGYYSVSLTNPNGTTVAYGKVTVVSAATCLFSVSPGVRSVSAGDTATFYMYQEDSTLCAGMDLRWQTKAKGGLWADVSGVTATEFSLTAGDEDDFLQVRAVLGTGTAEAVSNPAVVLVADGCAIEQQPLSVGGFPGEEVSFTVGASEGCSGYATKWQRLEPGASVWADVPDSSGLSHTHGVVETENGVAFRAVLTKGTKVVISTSAVLNVLTCYYLNPAPPAFKVAGDIVEFSGASGTGCNVQWQRSTDRGESWSDIPDATDSTYPHTVVPGEHGVRIRATHVTWDGVTEYSESVMVRVTECSLGVNSFTFTGALGASIWVGYDGTPACQAFSRRWQRSTDFGQTWQDVPEQTDNVYLAANLASTDDLTMVRMVVSYGGTSMVGVPHLIRVEKSLCELVYPMQSVTINLGDPYSVRYYSTIGCDSWSKRIESRSPGGSWETYFNSVGSVGGVTSSPILSPYFNGFQYRTVFTSGGNMIESPPATITIRQGCNYVPMDTVPSTMKAIGESAFFTIFLNEECEEAPHSLQWQRSGDGGQTWHNILGETTSSYTRIVQDDDYASLYRTALTTGSDTIYTRVPGVLRVASVGAPILTRRPTYLQTAPVGSAVSIRADAMGQEEPSVQWQISTTEYPGDSYDDVPGQTDRTLEFTPVTSGLHAFRPVFENSSGSIAGEVSFFYAYHVLTITPQADTVTGVAGSWVTIPLPTFSTSERGSGKWQRSNDSGVTWVDIASSESGMAYSFVASPPDSGAMFRAYAREKWTDRIVYSSPVTAVIS